MEADELQKQAAAGGAPASDRLNPLGDAGGADVAREPSSLPGQTPYSGPERRRDDRRERPTSFWASLRSPRRRSGGRRHAEGLNTYVDRYRKSDILLLSAVFGLNIADALFTLIWVQSGGTEGNPIMNWFLQQGDALFLFQKCLVVGLWLVILVIHKNFQLARAGLWLLLVLYGSIFVYHIFLQVLGVPMPDPAPVL